ARRHRDGPARQDQRGQRERQVDEEHPAPAPRGHQQSAHDRARGGADAGDRAPDAERAGPALPGRVGAWSRTSDAGTSSAAPAPWTSRAPTRTGIDGASPQAAEASAKVTRPARKTSRPPSRSASAPPASSSPANDSVYASTTHCRPATPPCSSRPIDGSATLTTITSRMTRKYPRHMT